MRKNKIQTLVEEIANRYSFKSISKQLSEIKHDEIKVKVAFLGEFSSGKTTLVNALLKKRFLPSFNKPTTAVVTEIYKGDENKFQVFSSEDDKEIFVRDIAVSDLSEEVQKVEPYKKIKIYIEETDLLDEDTVLIDTPGVASIEETHTDITYGYLPQVDAACVVINVNMGSVSNSLVEFINQYPQNIQEKICFILTHIDTKAPSQLENLKAEFIQAISPFVKNPKVYMVSSTQAIKANVENNIELENLSGVLEIKRIIKEDIPKKKKAIQESRMEEEILHLRDLLVEGLSRSITSLNFDDKEYLEALAKNRKESVRIEKVFREFKIELDDIKKKLIIECYSVAKMYAIPIIEKLNSQEAFDDIVENLTNDITSKIKLSLLKVDGLGIDGIEGDFANSLLLEINNQICGRFSVVNKLSEIANLAIIAFLAPATGGGNILEMGGADLINHIFKMGASDSKNEIKCSKVKKLGNIVSGVVSKFNLIGLAKDETMKKINESKVSSLIKTLCNKQVDFVFSYLDKSINDIIKEKYTEPLFIINEAMNSIREERKQEEDRIREQVLDLESDIVKLEKL